MGCVNVAQGDEELPQASLWRLVQGMVETVPALKGGIHTVQHNVPKGLQSLDQAALAGAVIADQRGQPAEVDWAAVADGFEVLQAETAQGRRVFHRMSPRSTSR